jgi:hypothetical protein
MLLAVGSLGTPSVLPAQDSVIVIRPVVGPRGLPRGLQREVAMEVIRFYNAPGTLHLAGATRLPAARGIDGDVAVLGGPVTIAGRISGALMVINGDLLLEPGAVIDGDVLVVGGAVRGQQEADVSGEVRSFRDPLRYRVQADTLVYAPQREFVPWRRARLIGDGSTSRFVLALGGTYNRVEGLPVVLGPSLKLRLTEAMRFEADARAVLRTAEDFSLETGRFGYRTRGELVVGSRRSNIGLGIRAYDLVQSVEPWPLKDFEAGWAAVLLHKDYRDWYRNQGWALYATLRPATRLAFTVEGREEDQLSMATRDPWAFVDNEIAWRVNPRISDGRYRTLAASVRYDSRNDVRRPSSGVLVNASVEATKGTDITGPVDPIVCVTYPCVPPSLADGELTYRRATFDARSYLRLTRSARLNLRLAGGGWLGGDDLPLQQRLSLGGPDPLPGWAFRQFRCAGGAGLEGEPALCDRALVMQAEYRVHLGWDFGPDWANDWGDEAEDSWQPLRISGPDIVVFADAGRAWAVGDAPGQIAADRLPGLSTFRTDIGVGLDLGPIGFYVAKSVGPDHRPATFTVRLGRRF